ncbi:MAG: imidazolonepropionase [Planctomycetota bacterium]
MSAADPRIHADKIITNLREAVTLAGPDGPRVGEHAGRVQSVANAAIAITGGCVVEVGTSADLCARYQASETIDGRGQVALPGFVDAHTHALFAGEREDEWEERLRGVSYQEIAARGGGIRASVRRLRAASHQELITEAMPRLHRMLACGTTTAEIKTGYGLSTESEDRSLGAIEELGHKHPIHVIPTFLGAHEVPDEHRGDRSRYLDILTEEMIPRFAGRARFCDVFCEHNVFNIEESRRILLRAKEFGMAPKLHADELSTLGGAELAAELGATSADHLVSASAKGLEAMAAAGVVAVLLPGTAYFLRLSAKPRVQLMREVGLPFALATDCNPGSSPTQSMATVLSLASHLYGLTPGEALVAATVNAAYAVGEGDRCGQLTPGRRADIALYDAKSWRSIGYHYGVSLVKRVFVAGRLAFDDGRVVQNGDQSPQEPRPTEPT